MSQPVDRSPAPRDLRFVIRVVTPLVIAALIAAAFFEYRRATTDVEQRFNERQAYLSRQAADRLAEVFGEVRKFLLVLEQGIAGGADDHALLDRVLQQLREHGAVAAWRKAGDGRLALSTGAPVKDLQSLSRKAPGCAPGPDLCVHGPLTSSVTTSGRVLVAELNLTGAAASRPAGSAPALEGTLGVVLDWGELQELIARITKLSAETYAWVLDGRGRLIMHPEHREQLGQDALDRGSACVQCHASFEVHRRMARGGSGTGRIQVVDGEPKLVAFTPFATGGQRWSLAVATPARQVTAQELGSLLSILLFTGAILLVMITGAVMLDRESSRRVRAAAAFNQELSAKVAERTLEIQALYDRLAALQAHHTRLERVAVAGEMAAIVAHEIRTPLNALSINAQMLGRKLRRGTCDSDKEKALEALGTLEKEIQRINSLLEDHLLALVRHRPRRTEPVQLNDLVSDTLRFMEPEAARAGVRLHPELCQGLSSVAGDPAKLRQVLLNIVLNAVQAMPDGGQVFISTSAEEGLGLVTIRDTGPGFADAVGDDIEQVFRPFVTTKEDGTGLGLAICARLVKEMNGKIRVFSKPGEGAKFVIAVPFADVEPPASTREEDLQPCH